MGVKTNPPYTYGGPPPCLTAFFPLMISVTIRKCGARKVLDPTMRQAIALSPDEVRGSDATGRDGRAVGAKGKVYRRRPTN